MPRWYDDGIRVNLSVSESGDFVSLGTRTEYPFVAGGNNLPTGWTQYLSNGAVSGDVNWTTANGRFSISNIGTSSSHQTATYGIYRDFPVVYGKRYVLWVQARTMDTKAGGKFMARYQFNGTGAMYGLDGTTDANWEQLAVYILPTDSSITSIRVYLANYYVIPPGDTERFDWGMQWQLPALVEFNSSYPDPVWHDVTCDVQSCTISYGRSKFTGRFDVATATIGVLNIDGEFTYQTVHPWGLRPGRFVKVSVTDPALPTAPYPAFYGLIDSINDTFPIDGKTVAVINCIDTSTLLSNQSVPTQQSDSTTSLSGLRFRSILDTMAFHPGMRQYDDGIYYQQAVKENGRTVRDELGIGADSEGALFWCDRSGILTFRDRTYISRNAKSNTVYAELVAECPNYVDEVKYVFPGVIGNALTAPYQSNFAMLDLDIYVRLSFDNITGAGGTIISQNATWWLRKTDNAKTVEFRGFQTAVSDAALPFNSNDVFWLRCTFSKSDNAARFYYCADQTNTLPAIGRFTQLGGQRATGGIPSGTNQGIAIGARDTGLTDPFKGRIYKTVVKNFPASGSVIIDVDPIYTPGLVGQISLPMPNSIVWTAQQTGSNVIVQKDSAITPYRLVSVDTVPTATTAIVQHLKALETDWNRDRVINDVSIANSGGGAYQIVNFDSQKKYGPRTYQRLDFVNDNGHPEYNSERANDFINGWVDAILRVNRVTFVPTPETYGWVLDMFLLDLVRIRYENPIEHWGFALATHIQGYVHNLTMGGWETSLNLDQPLSFVYYDNAGDQIGWDTGMWDSTLWDSGELAAAWDDGDWDTDIWDNTDINAAYWSSGQRWTNPPSKWS